MKNLRTQVIFSLVILMGLGALIVNAEEVVIIPEEPKVETLAICDHNDDGLRNLVDVAIFAGCTDTFDANDDGIHNLADAGEYAVNNQSGTWCKDTFKCVATPKVVVQEVIVTPTPATLNICDHNGDHVRNLTDVAMFAGCTSTFDVNADGVHDLEDVALYATHNQDDSWCADNFVCEAVIPEETGIETLEDLMSVPATLNICDHNGDHVRNLTDVAMFAGCTSTFDVNADGVHDLEDVALYATHNQDDSWCATNFDCEATPIVDPIPATTSGSGGGSTSITVSNLSVDSSCENTTITWETNLDSLTWMNYGDESENYSSEFQNTEYSHDHLVSLEDLEYDTTYYYKVATKGHSGAVKENSEASFTTISAEQCGIVLGEKIEAEEELIPEPKVLGEKEEVCTYMTPDEDVLGQTEWADGTLLRGCGPEVYRIENQQKRHIKSLSELFNYIGQSIYNVKNSVLNLF